MQQSIKQLDLEFPEAMNKEADLGLVLKYFLLWYEFLLERRSIKSVVFEAAEPDVYPAPVSHAFQDHPRPRPAAFVVHRMQQQRSPARRQDLASRAMLAALFRRWRDASVRRTPRSRLSDPDIISDFVRRLRERVDGDGGLGHASEPSPPGYGGLGHAPEPSPLGYGGLGHAPEPSSVGNGGPRWQPAAEHPPRLRSQGDDLQQPRFQGDPPQALTRCPESPADAHSRPSSPEPTAGRTELSSRTARTCRPASADTDSGGSVELCAEIMTSHALKRARGRPVPDTEADAELRRAPHLHSYLMNARSNRRTRRPVSPPAPAAEPGSEPPADRPPYQLQLKRRAELRRSRQDECRRLRQEREAASREAERQRHQEYQQRIAMERQRQLDELRDRRRHQEQLRRRRLRGQQALQQKEVLADGVWQRALVTRVFRALVLNVQRSRQLESAAEQWARSTLLQHCLLRWRHQRALVAAEREEAARHWRHTRLAAWALGRWRTYVHQQRLKEQAASDLSQLQRLQAALRTWQASLALGRVRRRQKMHRAAQCDVRLTCAAALRRWRGLHHALEEERAVEARKNRLRRIVREMLPDFQPVAVDPV